MIYNGAEMNALNFLGQKVTVQGHDGITYAGTITVQLISRVVLAVLMSVYLSQLWKM